MMAKRRSDKRTEKSKVLAFVLTTIAGIIIGWTITFIGNLVLSSPDLGADIKNKVSSKLKITSAEQLSVDALFKDVFSNVEPNESIIVYGKYSKEQSQTKQYTDACFIAIFDQEKKSFYHNIFLAEPGFIISSFWQGDGLDKNELNYTDGSAFDYNRDNKKELVLTFSSFYADRLSEGNLIIEKGENEWNLIDIDTIGLMKEIEESNNQILLSIDNFTLYSGNESKQITLLSRGGEFQYAFHPYSHKPILLLKVAYEKDSEDAPDRGNAYLYVVFKYENGKYVRDKVWNGGELLFAEGNVNPTDLLVNEYWGIRLGDLIFYGEEVFQ